jgi:hypothetical protein
MGKLLWSARCTGREMTIRPHLARSFVLAPFSSARYCPRMPKDALTLSDVRGSTLTVVCESCGRRGRYNVERLMAKHGDTKILYLLDRLANCPKAHSTNIYDRCKAKYEGLTTR